MSGQCSNPAAAVDQRGAYHVVAMCGTRIRYATSPDGRRWTTATFNRPAHRRELLPQIAIDGSTIYVAFTRVISNPDTCGGDGEDDIGVYYRSRSLPSGRWSRPVRIGPAGDRLQSFRVIGGAIHGTYASDDGWGPVSYRSLSHGTQRSVKIPGAVQTSLRIGDDGQARVAYTTGRSIGYAVIRRDGRLSAKTVFTSRDMELSSPALVLGAGDHAYLAWSAHERWPIGCGDEVPQAPKPGIYFGTDVTGSWQVKRISKVIAAPSLTLDVDRGRLSVAFASGSGAREMTRLANGRWSGARIPGTRFTDQPVLRREPKSGHLLLVATTWGEGSASDGTVVAFVKS